MGTSTPGWTAPVASVFVPERVAVATWANSGMAARLSPKARKIVL